MLYGLRSFQTISWILERSSVYRWHSLLQAEVDLGLVDPCLQGACDKLSTLQVDRRLCEPDTKTGAPRVMRAAVMELARLSFVERSEKVGTTESSFSWVP